MLVFSQNSLQFSIFAITWIWTENENLLLPPISYILCTLPELIILHWICKSYWIWQGDICRSEVNHTEIGRAHIWKILNKIYQPYRIYGYPVHKVAPFENVWTWVISYPVSRHVQNGRCRCLHRVYIVRGWWINWGDFHPFFCSLAWWWSWEVIRDVLWVFKIKSVGA